jgi:hypothetical protein
MELRGNRSSGTEEIYRVPCKLVACLCLRSRLFNTVRGIWKNRGLEDCPR